MNIIKFTTPRLSGEVKKILQDNGVVLFDYTTIYRKINIPNKEDNLMVSKFIRDIDLLLKKNKEINDEKIDELIMDYEFKVSGRNTNARLTNLLLKELNKIENMNELLATLSKVKTIYEYKFQNVNTRNNKYSDLNNSFKNKNKENYNICKSILRLRKVERYARKSNDLKNILNKNTNIKKFNYTDIEWLSYKCKNSKSKFQRLLLLLLSTGCRTREILNSKFKLDEENKNNLIIIGLAKKKEIEQISRPVLFITPEKFLEIHKQIKNEFGEVMTPVKFSSLFSSTGKYIKKYNGFKGEAPKILRKIYGRLAYDKYGNGMNYNLYLSKILGHSVNELTTSFYYSSVVIEYDEQTNITDKIKKCEEEKQVIKSESVTCECGVKLLKRGMTRHTKTTKHKNFMKNKKKNEPAKNAESCE